MKLLLAVPLILSWNFMFWGSIGVCRYAGEIVSRHDRALSFLALFVAFFLLSADQSILHKTALVGSLVFLAFVSWRLTWFQQNISELRHRAKRQSGKRVGDQVRHTVGEIVHDDSHHQHFEGKYVNRKRISGLSFQALKEKGKQVPVGRHSPLLYKYSGRANWRVANRTNRRVLRRVRVGSFLGLGYIHDASKERVSYESSIRQIKSFLSLNHEAHAAVWSLATTITMAVTAGLLWAFFTDLPQSNLKSTAVMAVLTLLVPTLLAVLFSQTTKTRAAGKGTMPGVVKIEKLFSRRHVAVLIPAYNEGSGVKPTIRSAIRLVGRENVFVINDCSTDDTSEIVRQYDINQLDLRRNIGKAKALQYAIKKFGICERFRFLLVLDADTEVGRQYLDHALPCFVDPEVSAVAGHAIPKWSKRRALSYSSFFVAYRIKLYMMTQAFLRYGQTSTYLNVSFIVPGFSSIYRTSVLPFINIAAPGLVIEDFNMTFELHKKELGRIAYSPKAVAYCHEPNSFKDYTSQIKRWHLGFWQTVIRHGFWNSRFSASLLVFIIESLLVSLVFVAIPIGVAIAFFLSFTAEPAQVQTIALTNVLIGLCVLVVLDLITTIIVALVTRKLALVWHGLFFFVLRWVDSAYFLVTLPMAFVVKSNGRWTSPSRLLR